MCAENTNLWSQMIENPPQKQIWEFNIFPMNNFVYLGKKTGQKSVSYRFDKCKKVIVATINM